MWSPWSHGGYGRQCRVHTTTFRTRALRSPAIDRRPASTFPPPPVCDRRSPRERGTETNGNREFLSANSTNRPPRSGFDRSIRVQRTDSILRNEPFFLSFLPSRFAESADRAKIRADTGSVEDRLTDLKRIWRG